METDRRTDGQTDRHRTSAGVELRLAAKKLVYIVCKTCIDFSDIVCGWICKMFYINASAVWKDIAKGRPSIEERF